MSWAVLAARFVLAGVFAVAGLAKLADLGSSRRAIRDFGVPDWLAPAAGLLLPLAELAVAGALVPRFSARWGAMGALVLLGLFIVGISLAMARGDELDCHCFGQFRAAPVGRPTLVRNGMLAGLAGFAVAGGPGASAVGWLNGLSEGALVGGVVVACLAAVQGAFSYQLLRQNGRLLIRLKAVEAALGTDSAQAYGLPVGALAPAFTLPGLDGEMRSLDTLRAPGRPVMLVFSHPSCGPCDALLPELARWQLLHAERLTIALISQGSPAQNEVRRSEHGLSDLLLQAGREVADLYQAWATPSAVLVNPDGVIARPQAQGATAIRTLLSHALDQRPSLDVENANAIRSDDLAFPITSEDVADQDTSWAESPDRAEVGAT